MLNVRPNDLLSRAASALPRDRRTARNRPRLCRVPPSWRTSRLTMSRAHFVNIVTGWVGGLALLIAVVLTVRFW